MFKKKILADADGEGDGGRHGGQVQGARGGQGCQAGRQGTSIELSLGKGTLPPNRSSMPTHHLHDALCLFGRGILHCLEVLQPAHGDAVGQHAGRGGGVGAELPNRAFGIGDRHLPLQSAGQQGQ